MTPLPLHDLQCIGEYILAPCSNQPHVIGKLVVRFCSIAGSVHGDRQMEIKLYHQQDKSSTN